ncbi:hypothetical protein Sste5346_005284 [Sporothrix stenoceras]|uniref:Uncharacterized protein n=1 Tax=Sporothrix stenoceras TaxID=5173 RepID=A0ABR3Z4B0_9PEZI
MDGRGVHGVADEDVNDYDVTAANDIDVYLTSLATGALFGNAAGVDTLLRTPSTNFAADLTKIRIGHISLRPCLPPAGHGLADVPVWRRGGDRAASFINICLLLLPFSRFYFLHLD